MICSEPVILIVKYRRITKVLCDPCSEQRRRNCAQCGVSFAPKTLVGRRYSYCDECGSELIHDNNHGKAIKESLPRRQCVMCGTEFQPGQRRSKCCSHSCQVLMNNRRRLGKSINVSDLSRCSECGLPCRHWAKRCRICVDADETRSRKAKEGLRRRRLAESGHRDIHWRTVGERDNWICHLCHGFVDPVAGTAYEPWGATVDHLIPIARGGTHHWWNVALAHRRCNTSRGAKPLGMAA